MAGTQELRSKISKYQSEGALSGVPAKTLVATSCLVHFKSSADEHLCKTRQAGT